MAKEIITQAETIEQAKKDASAALGVEIDNLEFEVLQQPQRKTLGLFGGKSAKVKAVIKETPVNAAKDYLEKMLIGMGIGDMEITVREETDKGCVLVISGNKMGIVIGRRGETLDALQYLTGLVANRAKGAYYRVMLDSGDYREKREQSLSGLGKKMASQAARTGRKLSLEPMNPYERRIIHTAVQEVSGATSWSVGREGNRNVMIGPSEDNPVRNKPRSRRSSSSSRRDRDTKPARTQRKKEQTPEVAEKRPERVTTTDEVEQPEREVRKFVPRSDPLPTVEDVEPPAKTKSDVEESSTLYGIIDL